MQVQTLPEIPPVEKLSPFVTRILGQNSSGFTLQGTNTYLVGHYKSKDRLLIDTASGFPSYANILKRYLLKNHLNLAAVVITHWHPDHYSGIEDVVAIAPRAKLYKFVNSNHPGYHGLSFTHWGDGQVIEVGKLHFKAYHTPGHCDDHLSIWLEEENALFSGDNLLGHGSSVFEDYVSYMNSLTRMRDLPQLRRVYPGHGIVIDDGVSAFNAYIEHRHQREVDIYSALKGCKRPLSDTELVDLIYKDLDARHTDIKLGAVGNTQHYLHKLENEGRVAQIGDKWVARL